jgi:hypothetical protein
MNAKEQQRQLQDAITRLELSNKDSMQIVDKLQQRDSELQNYYNNLTEGIKQNAKIINATNTISSNFVRILNEASMSSSVSNSTTGANAESSPIAASTVLTSISDNYDKCNVYILQLNSLIDWLNVQMAIYNK